MSRKQQSAVATAAAGSSSAERPLYVSREVPIDKVLPPKRPARENFDEDKLAELIESIRLVGILEPLIAEQEGDAVRIHAGHRRLVAALALGLKTVPCKIYPAGKIPGEAAKAHENRIREDLNPAEEARYFGRLLEEECGADVDELCKLVRFDRDYVDGRLQLLLGDSAVLDALGAGALSIGGAKELNKVKNAAQRRAFLDAAVAGGASVRLIRDWRVKSEALDGYAVLPATEQPLGGAAVRDQPIFTMQCLLCDGTGEAHEMEIHYIHRGCKRIVLDRFLQQIKGEAAGGGNGDVHG